jgi:hypothetical protein
MARGHHDGCRAGHCHPYCPVRPQEFGFYETNWRRWPASGVVPATNLEAATPAAPPRSEVPNADEEAAMLPTDESPVPEEGAAFRRGPQERPEAAAPQKTDRGAATMPDRESRPAVVTPPVPQGPQQPVPAAPQKAPPPPVKRPPPAQPQPPAKPSSSPEKDLFDESRAPAPLRRQTASGGPAAPRPIPMAASALPRSSGVEPAVVEVPLAPEPPALDTPRVRFEPAAEALRLRRTTPPTR